MSLWKRTEIQSLLLATVVLILTALSFGSDLRQSKQDRDADQNSRVILTSVDALIESLKDAEIGQRGYLLTRDTRHLEPYRIASAVIPIEVNRLRHILPRSEDCERLFQLVQAKLSELQHTVSVRDQESYQAALAAVKSESGTQEMEQIRAIAGKLTAAEYTKLSETTNRKEERTARGATIAFAGGAVLLGLLILSTVTINRSTRRREHLIALLQEDDRRLRELSDQARDAESKTRDILESIADGFVSFDRSFAITYVNSAAESIFDRRKEDLIGKNYWAEFPEDATPEVRLRYSQAMESKAGLCFEHHSRRRNTWWEESIYPAKDGGLSVYFRDVTERKRMEERSRNTQKLESLGVLAGGIAHDFNNLLTAILGGATLLQEDIPENSPAASNLKLVISASERATLLTRQMLAYSGRGRFVVEQIDLAQQIREITELLESSVTRDVELVLSLETDGVLVEADAGQIQQLLMNMVINGAEAIEGGPGTVLISTRVQELDADYVRDNMAGDNVVPGRYVLLEVHDTGKGMDQKTLSRIFDPFFTTKFTGRGLGLAAVLGIVRGHRGAIKVYSNPGLGTTFKVFFPVAQEQKSRTADLPPVAALHGNETILIVDDEETVQSLAVAALTKYGYRTLQARNGKEAIEIFEKEPEAIALVLLDMTMPVMSGEETLKRLKQIQPSIPVIASSGYNEIEALRRFGQGVRGFLQKPYRAAQLAEKIRGALASSSSAVT